MDGNLQHLAWNHKSHTSHWFVAWYGWAGFEQMLQRCLSPGLSSISPPRRRSNVNGVDLSPVRRHKRMSFLAEWVSRWITSIPKLTASFDEKGKPNVKPGIPLWFIAVYSSLGINFGSRIHINSNGNAGAQSFVTAIVDAIGRATWQRRPQEFVVIWLLTCGIAVSEDWY